MSKPDMERMADAVRQMMPSERWQHTLGVKETSIRLARQYGADAEKAELAALLHDCCKYWPVQRQAELLRTHWSDVPDDLHDVLDYGKVLWHAPAGAIIAARDYGISDREVLDAIRYHTTGREQMTLLDQIVCLADYIEPGRDFPEVNKIREIAEYSVERALLTGLNSTIRYLLDRDLAVYPLTLLARNALLSRC